MSGSRELRDYIADLLGPDDRISIARYFGGWAVRHGGQRRVEVSAYRAAPADLLESPEHLLMVLTASNQ